MSLLLGCIADDLTGASDIALMLASGGMNVDLLSGMEEVAPSASADAVVIGLKTRTSPVEDAVSESLEAAKWLKSQGASQLYFKYCSTFDSTNKGNIGPVAEALMDFLDEDITVVVPSFPRNGRTVYQGYLFVNEQLLSESGMKNHPLTPMTDANIVRVMDSQIRDESRVGLIPQETVYKGSKSISLKLDELKAEGKRYAVIDTLSDADLMTIGESCSNLSLLTGGSGLAKGLPQNFRNKGMLDEGHGFAELPEMDGPVVILAGSCSLATQGQVEMTKLLSPSIRISPEDLMTGKQSVETLLADIKRHLHEPSVLIYSSASSDVVESIQSQYGREDTGDKVEQTLASIAAELNNQGVKKFIVAGGETSGAVSKSLKLKALKVGPEIAPGVPWTVSEKDPELLIAFKSGNFGDKNFFQTAIGKLPSSKS